MDFITNTKENWEYAVMAAKLIVDAVEKDASFDISDTKKWTVLQFTDVGNDIKALLDGNAELTKDLR